ncbi:protein of unknown function [Caballeronia sp. S22]
MLSDLTHDFHEIRDAERSAGVAVRLTARMLELLDALSKNVASDVDVVAREHGLGREIRERLRRALGHVGCARCPGSSANEGRW